MKCNKRKMFCLSLLFLVLLCLPATQANAKSLRLNKSKVSMRVGEKVTLKVKGNKKKKKVTFKSSKPAVVKVTKKGVLKAKKKGKATIRVKVGQKTLKCKVTVKKRKAQDAETPNPDDVFGQNRFTDLMDAASLDDSNQSTRSLSEYEGITTLTNSMTATLPTLTGKETFAGLQTFSWNLFAQVQKEAAQKGTLNTVISPVSAYIALAMTAQGSLSTTQTQFSQVLGLSPEMLQQNTNVSALKRHLMYNKGKTKLTLANSIWIDESYTAKESYLQGIVDYFDAEIYGGALSTEQTKNAINQWTSDKTEGLIPELLKKSLEPGSNFALINTLYLNAQWESCFSANDTHEKTFYKEDNTEVRAEFIGDSRETLDYIKTSTAEGIVLPYDDGKTIFLALRPTNGTPIKDFAAALDATSVKRYISKAQRTLLDFHMPKFEHYHSMELKNVLINMGLADAFDEAKANFRNMYEWQGYNVYIDLVQQDVKIKVMEKGTEAAAATIIIERPEGATPYEEIPVSFDLDSPYVYVVMDLATQAPLFVGVMEDPTL